MECKFDTAIVSVCAPIRRMLEQLPADIKDAAQEIRLRAEKPVAICCGAKLYFLRQDGSPAKESSGVFRTVSKQELQDTVRGLCSCSVYSFQNELKQGYLTIQGGHRVGICGTAVLSGAEVASVRDISSVNIRIARQIPGAADGLFRKIEDFSGGLLLAGPPSSGKTTVLRDIVRQLSGGVRGKPKKVAIVDERGELAGTSFGVAQNDLGIHCDVLDGYPKGIGILQAVRTLSPEYIVCDELGGQEELYSLQQGLYAGVSMIASIHAGNLHDMMFRPQVKELIHTGAFQTVVLLESCEHPGKIRGIYKAGDFNAENGGAFASDLRGNAGRLCGGL